MRSVNVPPTSTPMRVAITRISWLALLELPPASGAVLFGRRAVGTEPLPGPGREVDLVRVEVVLHTPVEDRDVLVAVDRDLRRVGLPKRVDLVPDLLALGLDERLAPLGEERVGLLDADCAEVESDPAFQVIAEVVARFNHARTVEADVRL